MPAKPGEIIRIGNYQDNLEALSMLAIHILASGFCP